MFKTNRKKSNLGILITPPVLYLSFLYIIPVIIMVVYSFWSTDSKGNLIPVWNIESYIKIFSSSLYAVTLLRSFLMASGVTLICLILAYPSAYFIAKLASNKTKYLLLLLMIIPSWTSFLVRTYSWMLVLGEKGVLNYILMKIGLISEPINILFSLPAVFIGLSHIYFPYMFLPIFASIDKIPINILEMADSLGSTTFYKFLRVIVPLSFPGIMTGVILVFIPTLGEYVVPMILGGSKGMMFGNLIQSAFGTLNWPLGSALAFFLLIIILVIFFTLNKFFNIRNIWEG